MSLLDLVSTFQEMAWHLFGDKPLPEPLLIYGQVDP